MDSQSPFPLEQALLGFLMQEPAHGYALHQRAEEELGRIWYIGISNVYGTLKDLEETGEVASSRDEASYPPRKVYRITEAGRERFVAWVREPVAAVRDQRVELLAKIYFFYALKLEGLETLLEAQEALCRERLHHIEQRASEEPQDAFGKAVSDFRRLRIQATIDWLRTVERG
ncbi:MAG: helix-turn-helix transcriptional regulator [Anaerolineae bacterium]|jgi:DNA-binding PadR family transcriptional regulator